MGAKEELEAERAALAALNGGDAPPAKAAAPAPAPAPAPAGGGGGWGDEPDEEDVQAMSRLSGHKVKDAKDMATYGHQHQQQQVGAGAGAPAPSLGAAPSSNSIGVERGAGLPMGSNKWASDLFNVFGDGTMTCLSAFFFPWCTWGGTMSLLQEDDQAVSSVILFVLDAPVMAGMYLTGGLFPLHTSSIMSCSGRYDIRKKYGIKADLKSDVQEKTVTCGPFEGTYSDLWTHLFCLPCALVQERTTVKAMQAKGASGAMNAPKAQAMF